MDTKMFEIYPVGWGVANALIAHKKPHGSLAVITDGGTQRSCFRHLERKVLERFDDILRESLFKIWMVSHFDYDHCSIISEYLSSTNTKMDLCILPYVYKVDECIQALSSLYALKSTLFIRPKPPPLPRAFRKIFTNCSRFWFVKEGNEIKLDDDTSYKILWPPRGVPSETCKEIVDTINEKIVRRLKQEDRNKVYEAAEQFKEQLDKIGKNAIHTEVLDILSLISRVIEDISTESQVAVRPLKPEVPWLKPDLPFQVPNEYREVVSELALITRNLVNIYSVAYAINHSKDFYTMEIHNHCRVSWWDMTYLRMIARGFHTIPILYLADLDEKSLDDVLSKLQSTPLIVIAPHHGNAWSDMIRGSIAYLHRCSRHVPTKYIRGGGKLEKYFSKMLCILSEHDIGIRLWL